MRIPLHQTYRAFRELDGFSDEQCEQWVRRVRAQGGGGRLVASGCLAALLMVPIACMTCFALLGLLISMVSMDDDAVGVVSTVVFLSGTAGASGITFFLVRDHLLIRAIRNRVLLVRCPRCRYSLLGLRHEDGFVLCPECGTRHELAAIGLSPADLIGPANDDQRNGSRASARGS